MVRQYKRHSNRNIYDDQTIFKAVQQVRIHRKSVRKAAEECGIQYCSLQYYLKKYKDRNVNDCTKILTKAKQVFLPELEKKLVNIMIDFAVKNSGMSSKQMRQIAYQCATEQKLNIPKNWEISKMAGRDWLISFKKRNPVLFENNIPLPEVKKMVHVIDGSNIIKKSNIETYLNKLKDILVTYNLKDEDIFCMGEIGILASNRPNRILLQRFKYKASETINKDELVTMATTISASGSTIPPFIIFSKYDDLKDTMLNEAPKGSKVFVESGGWINNNLIFDYLKHFITNTECCVEKPCLLILVKSRTYEFLKVKTYAQANGIICLIIPSKYIVKLQPLEKHIFPSLRFAFNKAARQWVNSNLGISMKVSDILTILSNIYFKIFSRSRILKAFQITGIHSSIRNIHEQERIHNLSNNFDSNICQNIQIKKKYKKTYCLETEFSRGNNIKTESVSTSPININDCKVENICSEEKEVNNQLHFELDATSNSDKFIEPLGIELKKKFNYKKILNTKCNGTKDLNGKFTTANNISINNKILTQKKKLKKTKAKFISIENNSILEEHSKHRYKSQLPKDHLKTSNIKKNLQHEEDPNQILPSKKRYFKKMCENDITYDEEKSLEDKKKIIKEIIESITCQSN